VCPSAFALTAFEVAVARYWRIRSAWGEFVGVHRQHIAASGSRQSIGFDEDLVEAFLFGLLFGT